MEKLLKTIECNNETIKVYKEGDDFSDDYSVFYENGDCSVRGTRQEITDEIFSFCHAGIHTKMYSNEYDFLRNNEHLGENIILLGLGGSHAYGTNVPGSDVDLRGVALNTKRDLLGMTKFDTFVNEETDTTIYGVNKFIHLLMDANPNIIEFLGLEPEDYAIIAPIGKKILDSRDLFLSQRVYHSFGGYAYAQLKRLQNATARDSLPETEKEEHIMHSIEKQIENIEMSFENDGRGKILLYIDDAITEGHSKEIFMEGYFKGYPLRAFNTKYNAMNQVCKDYDHLDHRNRKKDEKHLNKHAMHLIRLYQMAIEMLSGEGIHTKRKGEDLALLMSIRNGKYMKDGIMTPEFYELVEQYQQKLEHAYANTELPKKPDIKEIEKLLVSINEEIVKKG